MATRLGILRPANGLMAGAAVFVGAFVTVRPTGQGSAGDWGAAALGAAAAAAAAGAANALNDYADREVDSTNRPERPIPSGALSPRAALGTAVAAYIVSMGLAALVSAHALTLAIVWAALTLLYSLALKGVPIVGNLVVAAVAATPLLMGALTQRRGRGALIPCALAFLIHLARELVKDAEDIEGDRLAGLRTFAVRYGPGVSIAAARIVLVGLIGLAAVPFALRVYGWGYAAVVCVIDALLVWTLASLGGEPDGKKLRAVSNRLKAVMALGLAAFVLGVF
jgi:geranylgeranylglycerol-phosphate geranylgeranyltransferase